MVLDPEILRKVRYEVGGETIPDVDDDGTIETIFNDPDEGDSSVLATALIIWRSRLGHLTDRAFDITTEGSLLSRSQKIRFIERRITALSLLVEDTAKGVNASTVGVGQSNSTTGDTSDGGEL